MTGKLPGNGNWKRLMEKKRIGFGRVMVRILVTLSVLVLLLLLAVHLALTALLKGPSDEIRSVAVMSLEETSALKFVPYLYLPGETVAEIENAGPETVYAPTDTSLVTVEPPPAGPVADAWGFVDEDGDGIILDPIAGEAYSGWMMIVPDPSRVVIGSDPAAFWNRGFTVEELVKKYDAVAGMNAGGFLDPNGNGNGATPDSLVVNSGKVYFSEFGCAQGFAGFDGNGILHVGKFRAAELTEMGITSGVCFGPVLVNNGENMIPEDYPSGVNPRAALGQRSDGAVLMLAIDGRQATSLGARLQDEAELMMRYGAVNACNLDGGSSVRLWFQDRYINNAASLRGVRPVPTAVLVLKEGVGDEG